MKDKEHKRLKALGWKRIKSAPLDGAHVHVWMQIHASPRSMGMSDAFAVADCWFENGRWYHVFRGNVAELYGDYIKYWMPADRSLDGQDVQSAA